MADTDFPTTTGVDQTTRELDAARPWRQRLRTGLRNLAVTALAVPVRMLPESSIRIFYYHHVLDNERRGFNRQLRYLRQFGDFVSLSHAVKLLSDQSKLEGRYFCVTFDDGFRDNLLNALPIAQDNQVPLTIFLSTGYMRQAGQTENAETRSFYRDHNHGIATPFLSWAECRTLIQTGVELGAHTRWHERLSRLNTEQVRQTMQASKKDIEEHCGRPCRFFAAPWGRPHLDFRPERDLAIGREVGFEAFLTTQRGPNLPGRQRFELRREHVMPNWSLGQLRYFLNR